MRKLFSTLAVVLIFAMAFTITASAAITGTEVYQPVSGKYTITAQDDDIKGAMVGMVVVESVDVEEDEFTEDNIRYIDQVTADAAGNISFPAFTPMDKKVDTNKYLVYVGGGELKKATKLGMLTRAPETVTISEDAKTMTIDDVANLTAAIGPDGATGTLSWDSDNKAVATVDNNGKVTALAEGTANITVTVDGFSATCAVTVTEKSAVLYGDIYVDGQVNTRDAMYLGRYFGQWTGYETLPNEDNADVYLDGQVNTRDAMALGRYFGQWTGYETLPIEP